ncbi:hypothetical protein GPK29_24545 [Aeromonas hydrophila]|uniref:hypothetical protein n=1 Tax=Aeromonas hydrophila TaxID=644 RepID=UPI001C5A6577|nr:hypothetical protein [Aeromonas hydrophila]MBW3799420.1 hypothetical protein [Aeromonas hydrophila]MBW3804134.1 hypothetical protein [Aeromonas hydrophila]MBW3821962.1 hypothetical protein [Aeromonas hydrophila]
MTRLITGLEVHRYAPELNKLHLRSRQTLPAPGITTIKEAKCSGLIIPDTILGGTVATMT